MDYVNNKFVIIKFTQRIGLQHSCSCGRTSFIVCAHFSGCNVRPHILHFFTWGFFPKILKDLWFKKLWKLSFLKYVGDFLSNWLIVVVFFREEIRCEGVRNCFGSAAAHKNWSQPNICFQCLLLVNWFDRFDKESKQVFLHAVKMLSRIKLR